MKRPLGKRLPSIALALLLGVLLCEGILRVAGTAYLAAGSRTVRSASELGPGGRTVLCLGDSNTYGLWVEAEDAYPSRLQDLMDERVPGGPHRVVNLGVPGTSSRQLLGGLPEALATYDPDLVLVLVGFNDRWSWKPGEEEAPVYLAAPWYEDLRVVKLLRLVLRRRLDRRAELTEAWRDGQRAGIDRTGREFAFPPADYEDERELQEVFPSLRANLEAICARAEDAGVPLRLVTYAAHTNSYRLANTAARRVGAKRGAPALDPAAWFTADAPPGTPRHEERFFPDDHPREPGYEVFARLVLNGLIEQGLLEGRPVEEVDADLRSTASPAHLVAQRVPGGVRLSLRRARPRLPVTFHLSGVGPGEAATVEGLELPLVDDALFRASLADPRLTARTTYGGEASVLVQDLLPGAGERIRAVCIVGTGDARRTSRVCELDVR